MRAFAEEFLEISWIRVICSWPASGLLRARNPCA